MFFKRAQRALNFWATFLRKDQGLLKFTQSGHTASKPRIFCPSPTTNEKNPSQAKIAVTHCGQCDQIGHILKSFGNKLSFKRSPSISKLLGQFEKGSYLAKTTVATFGQYLDRIRLFFIPASGPTNCGLMSLAASLQILF